MDLGVLDRFRGKKAEEKIEKKTEKMEETSTELEELLGDDQDAYTALSNTMFLNPGKVGVSMSEAAKKAKKFEKDEDLIRARIWYEIAGGLAIYEGDVQKVKEYFRKSQEISPEMEYAILKTTEAAVAKAREYYKKHLED